MIGKTLGHYEILEPLGAGGMGEVFLGRDPRLDRNVAIKVLPTEFASDPERLARFEQEARAAAALNHPHIAVVHDIGFEEGTAEENAAEGKTDPSMDLSGDMPTVGVHYMVQEYLQGHTLRTPLDKGALPLTKTLQLGTEIAEALAAAHGAGIVHRDLKPDNIFVTGEGHAKVLDFGLAKLTEVQVTSSPGAAAPGVSKSPTMLGTVAGQVMGTAGYMAPEQVHGEEVDGRADIFAFGCVLYQMVSGKQPFSGRSVLQTLDMIVNDEPPPLEQLNFELPAQIHWILKKCLAKDPARRYQHADDLAIDLRSLGIEVESGTALPAGGAGAAGGTTMPRADGTALGTVGGAADEGAPSTPGTKLPTGLLATVAVALVLVSVLATIVMMPDPPAPPATRAERYTIEIPSEFALETQWSGLEVLEPLDISPDGSQIVYAARGTEDPRPQLYLRRTDDFLAVPIAGTLPGSNPIFSPDGEWLAFITDDGLYRVPITGGAPQRIADRGPMVGGTWAADGNIYIAYGGQGVFKVPATGGTLEPLVPGDALGTEQILFPEMLPGDSHLLVTLFRPGGTSSIGTLDLADNSLTDLQILGSNARYLRSGHLLYAVNDALFAVPFDPESRTTSGNPTPVLSDVSSGILGISRFAVASQSGTLAYVPGAASGSLKRLVWADRSGNSEAVSDATRQFDSPRISPDGTRIVVRTGDLGSGENALWIYEIRTGTFTLLASGDAVSSPMWSADGEFVFFTASSDDAVNDVHRQRADFTGEASLVLSAPDGQWVNAVTDDLLVLAELKNTTGWDISTAAVSGEGPPQPFASTEATEGGPAVSPDGNWVAYSSNESGRFETYVQPFPGGGRRHTISTAGGGDPVWSHDGTELFFRAGTDSTTMMVVDVTLGEELDFSVPRQLFDEPYYDSIGRQYDVATDGRFLMLEPVGESSQRERRRVNVILNFFEELRERVPTGR